MLNNQQFSQQKSFLSQSKIFPDNKTYSSHNGIRNDKQMMYSSGIFMKNSSIMNNRPYDQYQVSNMALSPHKNGYINKNPSVQFINTMNTVNNQQNYQYKPSSLIEYSSNPNISNMNMSNLHQSNISQQPISPHYTSNININNNNNNNINNFTSNHTNNNISPINNTNPINNINPMNNNNNINNSLIINSNIKDTSIFYDKQLQQIQDKIQLLTKKVLQNQNKSKISTPSRNNSSTTLDQDDGFNINNINGNTLNNININGINNNNGINNINNNDNKRLSRQQSIRQFHSLNNNNNNNSISQQLQKHKLITIEQNSKIWKKLHKFQQLFTKLNIETINKKIQQLQQSFQLSTNIQIQKSSGIILDQHILTRIKFIQKSIRQMGQDIHLINDKQQNIEIKIQQDIKDINQKYIKIEEEIKKIFIDKINSINSNNNQYNSNINKKINQLHIDMNKRFNQINQLTDKKINQFNQQTNKRITQIHHQNNKRIIQVNNETQIIKKQLKSLQSSYQQQLSSYQQRLLSSLTSLQSRVKQLHNYQLNFPSQSICRSSTIPKYPYQPIVLKYLQKFKIILPSSILSNTNPNNRPHTPFIQRQQQIIMNELTYFIDNQGYILDNDRHYLIDENKNNQKVRLSKKHIQTLKNNKILI